MQWPCVRVSTAGLQHFWFLFQFICCAGVVPQPPCVGWHDSKLHTAAVTWRVSHRGSCMPAVLFPSIWNRCLCVSAVVVCVAVAVSPTLLLLFVTLSVCNVGTADENPRLLLCLAFARFKARVWGGSKTWHDCNSDLAAMTCTHTKGVEQQRQPLDS
jgi:hypothetical protein